MALILGDIATAPGGIGLNAGAEARAEMATLRVANTGGRPLQVGSHDHFAETNGSLYFDRAQALGMRSDIAAGRAVRVVPGQTREVTLAPLSGARRVYDYTQAVMGARD